MRLKQFRQSFQVFPRAVVLFLGCVVLQGSAIASPVAARLGAWATPVRLKAFAVDLLNVAAGGIPFPGTPSDLVQIVIERWSTPEEAAKITDALQLSDKEVMRVLDSFKPRVGFVRYLRSDESMPAEDQQFPLAYAEQSVGQGGVVRIVIATVKQRYATERESPIKVIEMRFGADGIGEGRIAAASIDARDGRPVLQLSNYTSARRCLRMIRRE